jgi:hypothetical protein
LNQHINIDVFGQWCDHIRRSVTGDKAVQESLNLKSLSQQDPNVALVLGSFAELDRVYHASLQAMGSEVLPSEPQVSNAADATVVLPFDLTSR